MKTDNDGRCISCVHWERYENESDIKHYGPHAGRCESGKFSYREYSQVEPDGLQYWDFESYAAGFNTGEMFGCVHWRKK